MTGNDDDVHRYAERQGRRAGQRHAADRPDDRGGRHFVGRRGPPPPQSDPFYQPPSGYESTAPGTVLRSRSVSIAAFGALPQKVQAWQLLYRTTDQKNNPQATVTTVLLPWGARPSATRPVLSYQVAGMCGRIRYQIRNRIFVPFGLIIVNGRPAAAVP